MSNVTTIVMTATTLGMLSGCNTESSDVHAAEIGPPSSCVACHQGELGFAGRDEKVLAEQIKAIRDAKKKHAPLALVDSSDVAIEKLAMELISE